MIHAASRESLAALRARLEPAGEQTNDAGGVAEALFAVSEVLSAHPGLRRALAEAATAPDVRQRLGRRVFEGRISAEALSIVADILALRWSTPWDMVDAVEAAGNQLLLIQADRAGQLDEVEDQLFRFGRIVAGDAGLRAALDDRAVDSARRAELARQLVADKALPVTVALIVQAVRSGSQPSMELAIDELLGATADRRHRSVASVTSAVPLTDGQIERLAAALGSLYGRAISVRVDIDPAIKGGLIVRVGDEVIDGSVTGRLAAARAGLSDA